MTERGRVRWQWERYDGDGVESHGKRDWPPIQRERLQVRQIVSNQGNEAASTSTLPAGTDATRGRDG